MGNPRGVYYERCSGANYATTAHTRTEDFTKGPRLKRTDSTTIPRLGRRDDKFRMDSEVRVLWSRTWEQEIAEGSRSGTDLIVRVWYAV